MTEGAAKNGIFDDFGDYVTMRCEETFMTEEEDGELIDALFALWKLEPSERRWAEMEYAIRGGRFEVRFVYEEEIERVLDADGLETFDSESERRDAIIARCLGAKQVRCPPLPGTDERGATFRLDGDGENGPAWSADRPSVSPASPAGNHRGRPERSVANGRSAELLVTIGNLLERYRPKSAGDTLLYAPVGDEAVGTDIFDDLGDHVRMRQGPSMTEEDGQALRDALSDLWELEPPERRWIEMEYVVRRGRFEVHFVDAEDVQQGLTDDGERDIGSYLRRRGASISAIFGDKPIRYPKLPWPR